MIYFDLIIFYSLLKRRKIKNNKDINLYIEFASLLLLKKTSEKNFQESFFVNQIKKTAKLYLYKYYYK